MREGVREEVPAWRDRPPVPGLYVCTIEGDGYLCEFDDLDKYRRNITDAGHRIRVYGPIPPDPEGRPDA